MVGVCVCDYFPSGWASVFSEFLCVLTSQISETSELHSMYPVGVEDWISQQRITSREALCAMRDLRPAMLAVRCQCAGCGVWEMNDGKKIECTP